MKRGRYALILGLAAVVVIAGGRAARATPQASLNTCQKTVQTEGKKFIQGYIDAVAACLQSVSTAMVQNGALSPAAAASPCVVQFRKISDTRGPGNSLLDKFDAKVAAKCLPGGSHAYTLQDILGTGAGVPQPLKAENINSWCANFGGDGSIDSLQEWLDCVTAAHKCAAYSAISTQYPRALEWLALVKPEMQLLSSPATDPTKVSDAVAGLTAVAAAMEGGSNDNKPTFSCGGSCGDGVKNGSDQCDGRDLGGASCVSLGFSGGTLGCNGSCALDTSGCTAICGTCGNGVRDGFESCDGSDLGGASCTSLGFNGGTLTCTAGCGFDVSNCQPAAFPASGQASQYVAGDDGHIQAGATLNYVDNGDGTISDLNTGLMWEKKSDDGGLHDKDNVYMWAPGVGSMWQWIGFVNAEGGTGLAGHSDWRIPSVKELQSIVDYQFVSPAVHSAFNYGCTTGCTVATCSCTQSYFHWSSTTSQHYPVKAWFVSFYEGTVNDDIKTYSFYVRAVRGGS